RGGRGAPGPLLGQMAGLARLLPSLALLVRGCQSGCEARRGLAPAQRQRAGPRSARYFLDQSRSAHRDLAETSVRGATPSAGEGGSRGDTRAEERACRGPWLLGGARQAGV